VKTIKIAKYILIIILILSFLLIISCTTDPCKKEPVQGTCEALIYKYYFDQETETCEKFMWGGCGGKVPFETMEECQITCQKNKKIDCSGECPRWQPPTPQYCPNGTIVYGGYDECGCGHAPRCVE
jgi:hypothetical protein